MATNIEIKRFSGGSWGTLYPKANWNNMDNKPSTFTPSSHTHTKSQITDFPSSMPASDVYAWAKASSKPSYSFSEINNRYESYLNWGGGRSLVGDFGPLDACLVPKLGANRVAGIDGSYITVEKSTNSGSTWTSLSTSDFSNGQRKALFTTAAVLYLKTGSTNTVNDRLRITMDATNGSVYTGITKIMMYISTRGSSGCKVLIETAYYGSPTTWHTVGTYDLSGWSGWNVMNLSLPGTGALGGSNSNEHNRFIRFTFSCTGVNNSYSGLIVYSIYMFGGVGWNTPSTLAANGVPYTYDESGNVTFPNALVSAYQFKEGGTLLSDKYQAKGNYLTSHQDISGKADKASVTAGWYRRVYVNAQGIVTNGDQTDANDDTNTWRKVQLNGTDKLGNGISTNPLNIKAGSNMTITESNGTFTFAATDTNTWRPLGTGADQAAAGNHTHTTIVGSYTTNGGQQNPNYFGTNKVGALMMNTTVNGNSQYKDWLFMDCYNGSDVGGGVAIGVNRQSLGLYIMRSAAARSSWAESAELIGTHNLSTYVKSWAQAANKPSYSFNGTSVTSGANSGNAVAAVTGYGNFSGGSGSLTGNTTASGGIPYVEASLNGTELTLTIKYLHHSHSGASLGSPSTSNVAPSGHTHSVTASGSVS